MPEFNSYCYFRDISFFFGLCCISFYDPLTSFSLLVIVDLTSTFLGTIFFFSWFPGLCCFSFYDPLSSFSHLVTMDLTSLPEHFFFSWFPGLCWTSFHVPFAAFSHWTSWSQSSPLLTWALRLLVFWGCVEFLLHPSSAFFYLVIVFSPLLP